VPWPNSLWHIDGHHSLIRWGFVVHGCVDGFFNHDDYIFKMFNQQSSRYSHVNLSEGSMTV